MREQARRELFEYLDVFYNRNRRHSALRYQGPAAKHAAWLSQHKLAGQALTWYPQNRGELRNENLTYHPDRKSVVK